MTDFSAFDYGYVKPSSELYRSRTYLKWILVSISVVVSIISIYFTDELVGNIKAREEKYIELYAKTLEYFASTTGDCDLHFIFDEIIVANHSIPVIIADAEGNPLQYRNIKEADRESSDSKKQEILLSEIAKMKSEHEPIKITLMSGKEISGHQWIYYKNSKLLSQLTTYPMVQLAVVAVLAIISFLVFNYSKAAEQNRVWVGLAKETAHQLGTPLSSLMAWVEYIKTVESLKNTDLADDLKKDVDRLRMIAERFSNIGSEPLLEQTNLSEVIEESLDYLRKRVSKKVSIVTEYLPDAQIEAYLNRSLFEWVIENLCKNAVDAMSKNIVITVKKRTEGHVIIDVADDGKGLSRFQVGRIFEPGYTTKKRGWGLGLTLVKRIIENYHQGKIYVRQSEVNKGTTIRMSLKT